MNRTRISSNGPRAPTEPQTVYGNNDKSSIYTLIGVITAALITAIATIAVALMQASPQPSPAPQPTVSPSAARSLGAGRAAGLAVQPDQDASADLHVHVGYGPTTWSCAAASDDAQEISDPDCGGSDLAGIAIGTCVLPRLDRQRVRHRLRRLSRLSVRCRADAESLVAFLARR
jgi:hypothetical protein